jgi:uncharacterized protein (DUF302 family)
MKKAMIGGIGGLVLGVLLTLAAIRIAMPAMMITTYESRLGVLETVTQLEERIVANGWSHAGTLNMNEKLSKAGVELDRDVRIVQLCKQEYAGELLDTDPFVSSLMPCAIGVWQGEDGKVHVSKMNTGLMGKVFGGKIAEVMGGLVAADERAILAGLVD